MAGGKDILIDVAKQSVDMYHSIGMKITEAKINGKIQTADSPDGIQAILPFALVMNSNNQDNINTQLKLFALSIDGGKSWKFVDLSQYDASGFKTFVPEFSEELKKYW